MSEQPNFRVALTADMHDADGNLKFKDLGLGLLEKEPHIDFAPFDEYLPEISADQLAGINGVVVLTAHVVKDSLARPEDLLCVSRVGVGYDSVDVPACTAADVLLTITKGAPDRPVAEATIGWMIALTHNFPQKDRLMREGNWNERTKYNGVELRDRTFGAVGLGGIAAETVRLLSIFGMNQPIAFDPFIDTATASELGVELVELDELLKRADFVSVHCPLTDGTHDLIGARELALMRSDAYLLNTARGGIVNEDALYDVLSNGAIAGAALDCYVGEPILEPSRFGELDNIILAPHSIAWTDEFFTAMGRMCCQTMVDLSFGREPIGIINPEVLDQPGFQAKWDRLKHAEG
jgi:phosphoglycerate dehydrogenase-like enzyme